MFSLIDKNIQAYCDEHTSMESEEMAKQVTKYNKLIFMVGFWVDPIFFRIGKSSFLNSFFSTIYIRLEKSKWGSKYPIIMNDLYQGTIKKEKMCDALIELEALKKHLTKFSPKDVVWDFEDLNALPPSENKISSDITDLSNYFVTTDGNNLLDVLEKAMNASIEIEEDLIIRYLDYMSLIE